MLARVRPEDLNHALFPLGHLTKPEVVKIARDADLPSAYSKESMDVCFVLDGQANYLKQTLGSTPGPILDIDSGKQVGTHDGHYLFTRGQRKGVQVAAGRPVYVIKTDATSNTVWVGDAHHLASQSFVVKAVNWLIPAESIPDTVMLKIRYASPPVLASIEPLVQVGNAPEGKAGRAALPLNITALSADASGAFTDYTVTAMTPDGLSGVTPGQIAVFYDTEFRQLLGGGYIETFLPHGELDPNRQVPELACNVS